MWRIRTVITDVKYSLSNSWGFRDYNETLRAAVNYCYCVGASILSGKGYGTTSSSDPLYPGDYTDNNWIICVGSYGDNGYRCTNDGECGHALDYGHGLDLLAPGDSLITTDNMHQEDFVYFSGTSAATPLVSGAIALLRSINDTLWSDDYECMLKYSTWDVRSDTNEWTWDSLYGHGAIRISTAMVRLDSLYDLSS